MGSTSKNFPEMPVCCEELMPIDGGLRCQLPAGHYGHHRRDEWTWKRYHDDGNSRRSWVMSDAVCKSAFGFTPPYQEEPPRSTLDGSLAPKFLRAYVEGSPGRSLVARGGLLDE